MRKYDVSQHGKYNCWDIRYCLFTTTKNTYWYLKKYIGTYNYTLRDPHA